MNELIEEHISYSDENISFEQLKEIKNKYFNIYLSNDEHEYIDERYKTILDCKNEKKKFLLIF